MNKIRIGGLLISLILVMWLGFQVYMQITEPSASGPAAYLIITTDDAGLCPAVNQATIRALEFGLVTSTSMMVVAPGFTEFAEYAIQHPEHDYGVHLVLTSENSEIRWGPILGPSVPSLVRADGSFFRTAEEVAEHASADDVALELEAQVRKVLDRGIRISHLDHHMWVLLQRPDLLEVFVRMGTEFKIPLRIHRDFNSEECGAQLQSAAEYQRLIQPLIQKGLPLLDSIETNNYVVPAFEKPGYFSDALNNLKAGVSEFVIHCSLDRPDLLQPGAADRRAADFLVFSSTETREQIERLGIQLITWNKVSQLKIQ